jgi:hypothetical protein
VCVLVVVHQLFGPLPPDDLEVVSVRSFVGAGGGLRGMDWARMASGTRLVAAGGDDHKIYVWNVADGG